MSEPETEHRYNSDLLSSKLDLEAARKRYPDIIHVLDHPELRAHFVEYDNPANRAKKRSLLTGVIAILLGALSLIIAAAEPLHGRLSHQTWYWLAVLSAFVGLAGLLIGLSGVMFRKSKSAWLCRRLMTERLRQFHFQTLVFRLPEIVASGAGAPANQHYLDQRAKWFAQFQDRFRGRQPDELQKILASHESGDIWLHPLPEKSPAEPASHLATQIFAAYRDLRIMHQISYANERLRQSRTIVPSTPTSQASLFSNASLLVICALFLIHVVVSAATIFGWTELVFSPWTHIVAIWIAIGALAIRALEEGLKPDREIERYQQYRFAVRAIRDRYDDAKTWNEKIEIMKQMERHSYDEMCDFLKTHIKARFIL
jgi:hypothetical protein